MKAKAECVFEDDSNSDDSKLSQIRRGEWRQGWAGLIPSNRFRRVRSFSFMRQSRIRLIPPRRTLAQNQSSNRWDQCKRASEDAGRLKDNSIPPER